MRLALVTLVGLFGSQAARVVVAATTAATTSRPADTSPGRASRTATARRTCAPATASACPADQVAPIRVNWTIDGQAPTAALCANQPDWYLDFNDTYQQGFGFAPVPCMAGVFSVDKMPTRYFMVEMGVENGQSLASGQFDDQGHVLFDVSL